MRSRALSSSAMSLHAVYAAPKSAQARHSRKLRGRGKPIMEVIEGRLIQLSDVSGAAELPLAQPSVSASKAARLKRAHWNAAGTPAAEALNHGVDFGLVLARCAAISAVFSLLSHVKTRENTHWDSVHVFLTVTRVHVPLESAHHSFSRFSLGILQNGPHCSAVPQILVAA